MGKRKESKAESELKLAKDKVKREVFKTSKLLSRSPVKQKEMEKIMKKLAEIDTRIKEECAKMGKRVDELKEEGRRERNELKKMWEEDKKQMYNRIGGLEDRLEKLEKVSSDNVEMSVAGEDSGVRRGQIARETEKRMRKMKMELEKMERETRRQNVILKGLDMRAGVDWKQEVDRVWERMKVVAGRTSMRKIDTLDKEGKGLLLIRLEGIEKKREVMKFIENLRIGNSQVRGF